MILCHFKKLNRFQISLFILGFFAFALLFWGYFSDRVSKSDLVTLAINGSILDVEVVRTPELMAKGLGGRDSLFSDGMLFVYPYSGFHSFWMKDMRFSIDMIWLDQTFSVVHIERNVSPDTFPQVFRPNQPANFVFEAPAGFSEKNKISVGDILNFSF